MDPWHIYIACKCLRASNILDKQLQVLTANALWDRESDQRCLNHNKMSPYYLAFSSNKTSDWRFTVLLLVTLRADWDVLNWFIMGSRLRNFGEIFGVKRLSEQVLPNFPIRDLLQ